MNGPAPLAFLFPGQGSQAVGMGRSLAQTDEAARDTFAEADDALGERLSRLMWEGPADELTRTRNAQPALLVHGVAAARALGARGARPAAAAGHSLGEFTALVAAGALAFADAVRLVRARGELMAAAGNARPGTMAAVLGLDDGAVQEACREAAAASGAIVVPANLNAPGQVVISGDPAAVEAAVDAARARGAKRIVPLQVSGAFHSPLMDPAADGLRAALEDVALGQPTVPVISNVTGGPHDGTAEVRRRLVEQLTSPVRWNDGMLELVRLGHVEFVECGPGKVLTGLARRVPGVRSCTALGEAADLESFGWASASARPA